jgi:hypothetical protein
MRVGTSSACHHKMGGRNEPKDLCLQLDTCLSCMVAKELHVLPHCGMMCNKRAELGLLSVSQGGPGMFLTFLPMC